ncbi:MAG: hypothetical protein Kow0077_07910 [Anaerolineae bacterium]
MFRQKVWVLFLVVALIGVPVSSLQAQGGGMPNLFCQGLSEEDCAILEQAQQVMAEVTAVAMDMQLDVAVSGVEDVGDGFAMSMAMDGVAAVDPELAAMMTTMQDAQAMSEMMAQGMQLVVDMLRGVQGDVNLELSFPAEMAAEIGIPMETLATRLVMADGVLYVNLEQLVPPEMAESEEAQMPAWIGIDLAGMYEMLGEMAASEGVEGMPDMQELFASEELAALYDFEKWGDFVQVTRLEDDEIDSQPQAVFHVVLDYGAIFGSPEFQEAFLAYMARAMELSGEDMADMPENFMDVMQVMMSGLSLEMTQWIGLEDYWQHRIEMDFAFAPDVAALVAIEPEAADMPEDFAISFHLLMNSAPVDGPVTVEVPEDAQVINPMMLAGMADAG